MNPGVKGLNSSSPFTGAGGMGRGLSGGRAEKLRLLRSFRGISLSFVPLKSIFNANRSITNQKEASKWKIFKDGVQNAETQRSTNHWAVVTQQPTKKCTKSLFPLIKTEESFPKRNQISKVNLNIHEIAGITAFNPYF